MLKVLATDLDGTLIPLEGVEENVSDLQHLKAMLRRHHITIIFVTGRHIESVQEVINEKNLPAPKFIIADVGASIYRPAHGPPTAPCWEPMPQYQRILDQRMSPPQRRTIKQIATTIKPLQLQEDEKQGRHKISFYVEASVLQDSSQSLGKALDEAKLPTSIIASVDPFNGVGLIDVLPNEVSKSFALNWLIPFQGVAKHEVVFAGDSGNDYAAMVGGFNTIVVGNASEELKRRVSHQFQSRGDTKSVCFARQHATSGVLEGIQLFAERQS
jgi:sucrose-6F-phosphate phosphohydrolase